MDTYNASVKAIFDHCGYSHGWRWRVLPLRDAREYFWHVDERAGQIRFSASREVLVHWLTTGDNDAGVYESLIWRVCRGAEFTLIVEDTQTDGNKFLSVFRNAQEVTGVELHEDL